jgi:beta-glucosidase
MNKSFPDNFLWGTASSAYQTEGNNTNCDWFLEENKQVLLPLSKRKLTAKSGIATDFWNKFSTDFSYAEKIGVNIHRISIEWSRIFPHENDINHESIIHYRKILQDLKNRNIKIMLCLHHFTLPSWIAEKKGLLNRDYMVEHFSIYADLMAKEFAGYVDFWLTINEPNIVSICCYLLGEYPPFHKNIFEYLYSLETVFQMHLVAVKNIKNVSLKSKIGLAYAFQHFQPYNTKSVIDRLCSKICFYFLNTLFLN